MWTYPNGQVCHYFSMMFTTRSFSGAAASDGGDNLKVGWFKPDALPKALPAVIHTLEAFQQWKATGAVQII